ncbi:MAG TPA: putative glycoside hydrolase [Thermomicrobiales bacterium]|nr:putative glycoside hydrolase [Thermomicrobiales bacterium]
MTVHDATRLQRRVRYPANRRAVMRAGPAQTSRGRRWAAVSWWYSLLFLVPVTILASTWIVGHAEGAELVSISVSDQYTGEPLSGVRLVAGSTELVTDSDGRVRFPVPNDGPLRLAADAPGYEVVGSGVGGDGKGDYQVSLRPTSVTGALVDAGSGEPIVGASVSIVGIADPSLTATTAADGTFRLEGVPSGGRLRIDAGDYGVVEQPLGEQTRFEIPMAISVVTGQVVNAVGDPLPGAVVQAGEAAAITGDDGRYRLSGVQEASEVTVSASGYGDVTASISQDRVVNATLEQAMIKAAYANQFALADPAEVDRLIELIDTTELNALVIDIKQDTIYYDTKVPFFRELEGMVVPLYDPSALLAKLDERGIYSIARLVVFKDPLVAEQRPDLTVMDENTGEPWRDFNGSAWVNAFFPELWDANIELALEAGALGFDEVQYDYVRFPSDGDLTTADFGPDYSQEARERAITGFIERSSERIRPTGLKLAADLFGMIALRDNDQGIGQRLSQIVPLVDYVSLMVYPSHYVEGNISSAPGHPNDYPYETVFETLQLAEQLVPGTASKHRPWLQDFSYPVNGLRDYTAEDVAAQIQAAEDFGASGWMLWNPANEYSVDALDPG